jgi:hypothetical protein
LSVGLAILNSFQLPVILDSNRLSIDHALTHVTLTGLVYYNNTAEKGTLLYVHFQNEHQNIVMTNCRFINNFSTKGALLTVQNGGMRAVYKNGAYVDMVIDEVLTAVWVSPRYANFTNLIFRENYEWSCGSGKYRQRCSERIGNSRIWGVTSANYSH